MVKMFSLWVNFLVVIAVMAKAIAAVAAAMMPMLNPMLPGRVTIKIPINPRPMARDFVLVKLSPKNNGAASATQIGTVNSNAKSWARGINVTA